MIPGASKCLFRANVIAQFSGDVIGGRAFSYWKWTGKSDIAGPHLVSVRETSKEDGADIAKDRQEMERNLYLMSLSEPHFQQYLISPLALDLFD